MISCFVGHAWIGPIFTGTKQEAPSIIQISKFKIRHYSLSCHARNRAVIVNVVVVFYYIKNCFALRLVGWLVGTRKLGIIRITSAILVDRILAPIKWTNSCLAHSNSPMNSLINVSIHKLGIGKYISQ